MTTPPVARRKPGPVDVHVGQALKARRIICHMTQTDLGRAIGVTFQQVQKYEKGANRVSASMLVRVAAALGCDLVDLFPDAGEPTKVPSPLTSPAKTEREFNGLFERLTPGQRSLVLNLMRELTEQLDG